MVVCSCVVLACTGYASSSRKRRLCRQTGFMTGVQEPSFFARGFHHRQPPLIGRL